MIQRLILANASLAQMVEQLPFKEMVGGSIPSRGTESKTRWTERKPLFVKIKGGVT
jgi:hypothetical protein